jgi:hypothetical protein
MNNMPGFTAEVSLSRTMGHYYALVGGGTGAGLGVTPAFCFCLRWFCVPPPPPPPPPPSICVRGPDCVSQCMTQCLGTGELQANCDHDCNCCCNGTPCVSPGNPPNCCVLRGPGIPGPFGAVATSGL